VDGHDYVDKAAQAGAVAALTTKEVGSPAVIVEKLPPPRRRQLGLGRQRPRRLSRGRGRRHVQLAAAVARELSDEHGLTIVGVTGSDGKNVHEGLDRGGAVARG